MFRYRLYAQSFTIVAMLGGSYYYKADRLKRNEFVKLKKQREAQEKKDAWIKELEARDAEDKEWRTKMGIVRDVQREEAEMGVGEERRARDAAMKAQEAGLNDDGRGVIAAIRNQINASRMKEEKMEMVERKIVEEAGAPLPSVAAGEPPKDKHKSLLGESEAGGLFGIGHLKAFWRSRKPKRPEDE